MRPFRWHHSGFLMCANFTESAPWPIQSIRRNVGGKCYAIACNLFTMAFFRWSFSLEMVDSNALGLPPRPLTCCRLCSPVFTCVHRFPPVFTRIHPFSPVFARFHPLSTVFTRFLPSTPSVHLFSPFLKHVSSIFIIFSPIFIRLYQILPIFIGIGDTF